MIHTMNLSELTTSTKYFAILEKAGINFKIFSDSRYDYETSHHTATIKAQFAEISTCTDLANIWSCSYAPLRMDQVTKFRLMDTINHTANVKQVTSSAFKKASTNVKFYAEEVFSHMDKVGIYQIITAPVEHRERDSTFRICFADNVQEASIVYAADQTDPYFNYIDAGHLLVTVGVNTRVEHAMFITDQLTLDMNYVIAAFSIHPECLGVVKTNWAFISSKDARENLSRIERAIPGKLQPGYQKLKTAILIDFQKNSSNVMFSKLLRSETPVINLNNIKVSSTKAEYTAGNVSIEASNLAEVIFDKLNVNEEWDIFTLINIYTDFVERQFLSMPLDPVSKGFRYKKIVEFKINNIPLKVECFTENTRRAINGHLINSIELSKTIRRAACYLEVPDQAHVKEYNNFLKEVARLSLKLRDVLANGLPVKTVYLDSDSRSSGKDATNKHPKLQFVRKGKKGVFLLVNYRDELDPKVICKTEERHISKFAEFVDKVKSKNKAHFLHGHDYNYGNNQWRRTNDMGWEYVNGNINACAKDILQLIGFYAEGIVEEDKTALIGHVNREMAESEKRSLELLKEACETTGTTKVTRAINGVNTEGYKIKGQLHTYFVDENSLRVYAMRDETNNYVCVVNGKGDQGVGKDSLVARIYALHNDDMVTKQIHTLATIPART